MFLAKTKLYIVVLCLNSKIFISLPTNMFIKRKNLRRTFTIISIFSSIMFMANCLRTLEFHCAGYSSTFTYSELLYLRIGKLSIEFYFSFIFGLYVFLCLNISNIQTSFHFFCICMYIP